MADRILAGHGSGGKLMNEMIGGLIRRVLGPESVQLDDSAVLSVGAARIAFTTDTFTITPIEFPGGTIGSLAVNGTVNDLAMMGARPLYLSCALILEEGLETAVLERILVSMRGAADYAGVSIVTGDTKVVPKGSADGIFINTSGIGRVEAAATPSPERIADGDCVLVSGPVGNHGMAVMLSRAEFSFDFDLQSDSASVWPLVEKLLTLGSGLKFLRDPTRGGIAATLNEIASMTGKGVVVDESSIPLDRSVVAASEMLGIDPLQAANEGKIVAVVERTLADRALKLLSDSPLGNGAAIIGEVVSGGPSRVVMTTRVGGSRILAEPSGELLPRIC